MVLWKLYGVIVGQTGQIKNHVKSSDFKGLSVFFSFFNWPIIRWCVSGWEALFPTWVYKMTQEKENCRCFICYWCWMNIFGFSCWLERCSSLAAAAAAADTRTRYFRGTVAHSSTSWSFFCNGGETEKLQTVQNPDSIRWLRRLWFACGDLSGSNLLCPLFASPVMYLWGMGPISNYWPELLSPLQGRPLPVCFVFCLGSLPTFLCYSSVVQPNSSKALASFSLYRCWHI